MVAETGFEPVMKDNYSFYQPLNRPASLHFLYSAIRMVAEVGFAPTMILLAYSIYSCVRVYPSAQHQPYCFHIVRVIVPASFVNSSTLQ